MTIELLDPITDTEDDLETGPVAHIIRVFKDQNPYVVILEARANNTPVTALCGKTWVPDKNPANLPVCEKCKEVYEMEKMFDPDVNVPEAA